MQVLLDQRVVLTVVPFIMAVPGRMAGWQRVALYRRGSGKIGRLDEPAPWFAAQTAQSMWRWRGTRKLGSARHGHEQPNLPCGTQNRRSLPPSSCLILPYVHNNQCVQRCCHESSGEERRKEGGWGKARSKIKRAINHLAEAHPPSPPQKTHATCGRHECMPCMDSSQGVETQETAVIKGGCGVAWYDFANLADGCSHPCTALRPRRRRAAPRGGGG